MSSSRAFLRRSLPRLVLAGALATLSALGVTHAIGRWTPPDPDAPLVDHAPALHPENPRPGEQDLVLDAQHPEGLLIARRDRAAAPRTCALWGDALPTCDGGPAKRSSPYVCVCDGDIQVRQRTPGSLTSREW